MTRFVAVMQVTFAIPEGSEALAVADAMELSGRISQLSTPTVEVVEVLVDSVEEDDADDETLGG